MGMMLPYDIQLANEHRFSRKFIDTYLRKEITENPNTMAKVMDGVNRLNEWLVKDHGYESKNTRLKQLHGMDLEAMVLDVFVGVAYCQTPELFTSITAQLAGRLNFDDKRDSILTVAEITAVLCMTDAFDIVKADKAASLMIQSRIHLSDQLLNYVAESGYLPPMVCEPNDVTTNYESGYLTHNDCLLLGKGNGHDGELCLDVINIQNKVALTLDLEFLSTVEEVSKTPPDTHQKIQQWEQFKAESYVRYLLIAKQGNRFHLTNKVDTRGRMYAQGYHISTQASAFKKAMIEFAEPEIVNGVPST